MEIHVTVLMKVRKIMFFTKFLMIIQRSSPPMTAVVWNCELFCAGLLPLVPLAQSQWGRSLQIFLTATICDSVEHENPCKVYIKMVHLNMVTNSCVQYSPIHAILFGLLSVFINAYCSNLTFTYLSWIISEQYNWESCELMDPNGLICLTMYLSRPIDSLLVLEVIFVHP